MKTSIKKILVGATITTAFILVFSSISFGATVVKPSAPVITGPNAITREESQAAQFSVVSTTVPSSTVKYIITFDSSVEHSTTTSPDLRPGEVYIFYHNFPGSNFQVTTTMKAVAVSGSSSSTQTSKTIYSSVIPPTDADISYEDDYVNNTATYIPYKFTVSSSVTDTTKKIRYSVYFDNSSKPEFISGALASGAPYKFTKNFTTSRLTTIKVLASDGISTSTSEMDINVTTNSANFFVSGGSAVLNLLQTYKVGTGTGIKEGCFGTLAEKAQAKLSNCPETNTTCYTAMRRNVNLSISYYAQVMNASTSEYLNDGDVISADTTLRLHFVPHKTEDLNWVITDGAYDSPYGYWIPSNSTSIVSPTSYRTSQECSLTNNTQTSSDLGFSVYEPYESFATQGLICSPVSASTNLNTANAGDMICTVDPTISVSSEPSVSVDFRFTPTMGFFTSNNTVIPPVRDYQLGTWPNKANFKYTGQNYVVFPTNGSTVSIPFRFNVSGVSVPPTVTLSGPVTALVNTDSVYNVVGDQVDGQKSKYLVSIDSTNTNYTFPNEYAGYLDPKTSAPVTVKWATAGSHQICAKALSEKAFYSTSTCLAVTVSKISGGNPTAVAPSSSCSTTTTNATVTLYWGASSAAVGGYEIENSSTNVVGTVGQNVTSYSGTGVMGNSIYYVYSIDGSGGKIDESNPLVVTTPNCSVDKLTCDYNSGLVLNPAGTSCICEDSSKEIVNGVCITPPVITPVIPIPAIYTCGTSTNTRAEPSGYILASSTPSEAGVKWDYILNDQEINSNNYLNRLQPCQWTCYKNTDTISYSKLGSECVSSTIKPN